MSDAQPVEALTLRERVAAIDPQAQSFKQWHNDPHGDIRCVDVYAYRDAVLTTLDTARVGDGLREAERAALAAGTHEPAVDDFGNQYLAALHATTPPRSRAMTEDAQSVEPPREGQKPHGHALITHTHGGATHEHTLDAARARDGLLRAARMVDEAWYETSRDKAGVHLRYASDIPQRLLLLRAVLHATATEESRNDLARQRLTEGNPVE